VEPDTLVQLQTNQEMMKNNQTKRDSKATQAKILDAAYRVFAKNEFGAASIRMIAREGGVPHGLIRYYFQNKVDLFETVAKQVSDDIYKATESALVESMATSVEEGFLIYVTRLVEFAKAKPWAFRILTLNLSMEKDTLVPGKELFLNIIEKVRARVISLARFKASQDEIWRFTDSFNALIMYYLGTPESAAWLLHLDPDSEVYTDWVCQTMFEIFYPNFQKLLEDGKTRK